MCQKDAGGGRCCGLGGGKNNAAILILVVFINLETEKAAVAKHICDKVPNNSNMKTKNLIQQ